ncbi:peroxisomal leader peptide-processing protease [Alligator sinensis]|uniref:Peroxisomal leader peptide-processing protease n=1 Tax=Alligator sinensis TaxID=38654 RepID=A0A3Q0H3L0_ALLSI|nr:peroxisomal leader peptide-processing protease [Alligator sinensis]
MAAVAPFQWLRLGQVLWACGSPFGALCPDIFLNTLSRGVVSNLAGPGNALVLTDARCLPGTEGAGVFAACPDGPRLVGVVAAPLCCKAGQWPARWPQLVVEPLGKAPEPRRQVLPPTVLVECGAVWGSGVAVKPRLVLTCRHVVSQDSAVCVRVWPSPETSSVINGRVVFATQDDSPFDIAVVELQESLLSFAEPVLASKFCEGEEVSVVGFGVFGQACGPSVTSGILSAVITVANKAVMLQTTCAVHGGSSGGALFSTHSGELLGIVASNTKDNSVGAIYPHLNFSIPITILQPMVSEYSHTGDLSGFQELNRACESIKVVWRLQRKPTGVLHSKL